MPFHADLQLDKLLLLSLKQAIVIAFIIVLPGTYSSVRDNLGDTQRARLTEEEEVAGCCNWAARESKMDTLIDLERADGNIEIAKVKVADAEVKIVRAMNYIKVVEDALKKSPGNNGLEDELAKV